MKLIYVAGAGRSGSTLLDRLLGTVPSFASVGEVRFFWEYVAAGGTKCGCGDDLVSCRFWAAVLDRLHETPDSVDIDEIATYARSLDRTRYSPAISAGTASRRRGFRALVTATTRLYEAIRDESNADVIIDSSKVPSHLALLGHVEPVDLQVLHLVRDPRAVAYSWYKRQKKEPGVNRPGTLMPRRFPLDTMGRWLLENHFTHRFSRSADGYSLLRYEDLVASPAGAIGGALRELGIDGVQLGWLETDTVELSVTHSVGGNPIRFDRGPVAIRRDDTWRRQMSPGVRKVLGLLVYPLMRRYGYPL